jgi:phage baseplate assembly protein W
MSTQRQVGAVGVPSSDDAELEQSLGLCLTLRKGSVPNSPELGSLLYELIDAPLIEARSKAPAYVRQAAAIDGRLVVLSTVVASAAPGEVSLDVTWRPKSTAKSRTTRVTIK